MNREKQLIHIFAVSDIHGCASVLKAALSAAGFDSDNPSHLLIVLGDLFDRGTENRQVLAFLNKVKNKVLIKGNHEDILASVLSTGVISNVQCINGTVQTVSDFFPYYHGGSMIDMRDGLNRTAREMLTRLVNGMQDYFESERYVFTHGWITENSEKDFRFSTKAEWDHARWLRWRDMYPHFPLPAGKTLVVGHTSASYGYLFKPERERTDYSTLELDRVIAIDGTAHVSGRINVLHIEDYVTVPVAHSLALTDGYYRVFEREDARVLLLPASYAHSIIPSDRIRLSNSRGWQLEYRAVSVSLYQDIDSLERDYYPRDLGFFSISEAIREGNMPEEITEERIAREGIIAVSMI